MDRRCIPPQNLEDKFLYLGKINMVDSQQEGEERGEDYATIGIRITNPTYEFFASFSQEDYKALLNKYGKTENDSLEGECVIAVFKRISKHELMSDFVRSVLVDNPKEYSGIIPFPSSK